MEKAMAAHSGTLAWKIPWTEEPGGNHFKKYSEEGQSGGGGGSGCPAGRFP